MGRKITMVAAMAMLLALVSSVAYSAGPGGRDAAGRGVDSERLAAADEFRQVRAGIKPCPRGNITLKCINKNFNKLRKAFNNLVLAHNSLAGFVTGCLRGAAVTQYGTLAGTEGYMYDTNNDNTKDFNITALDFTEAGGTPSVMMVHAIC